LSSLKFLSDRGVFARAKTCFPPQTIPAWISIFTGVNPGKHGVFSFFKTTPRGIYINNALDIKYPPIYELFSIMRRPCVLVNVPLSYPFPILYGVGIADWLSPHRNYVIRFRKRKKISDILSEYSFIDPKLKRHLDDRNVCEGVGLKIDRNSWVIESLLEMEEFENYFIVISELDWIFHRYYHLIRIGKQPSHITRLIAKIDRQISRIIDKALKRGLQVFVISDHGFSVYRRIVFVNEILRRMGFARGVSIRLLSSSLRRKVGIKSIRHTYRLPIRYSILNNMWSILLGLKLSVPFGARIYRHIIRGKYRLLVDKDKSMAYCLMNIPAFYIMVNKHIVANPPQLAEILIKRLQRLHDTEGSKIFSIVAAREKLYRGPYVNHAPHIGIFGNVNAHYITSAILTGCIMIKKLVNYHDFYGIFIAYGDGIPHIHPKSVSIYDLVPTMLATEGLPIPIDTDGRDILSRPATRKNYLGLWKITRRLGRIRRAK